METYRKKLKIQSIFLALALVVLIAVQVLAYLETITPIALESERWSGLWNGFIAGACLGLSILFFIGLLNNIRAFFREDALKKLYIKAHDERNAQIAVHAQSMGCRIFLSAMLVVIIVAGYFHVLVCLTCLAVTVALSLTVALCKLYYCRKL